MTTNPARLMTIAEAAASLHDAVTESALHRARRDGLLWAKKIGKRYFTTQAAIMEFLECPDTASPPASISATMSASGLSVTETPRNGQDLLLASVKRLKTHSLNTSQTGARKPAPVLQIHRN